MPWIDTSNYSFLGFNQKNENKYFVFYYNIFFNLINSSLILIQVLFGWLYFFKFNFTLISIIILKEKKLKLIFYQNNFEIKLMINN